MTGRPTARRGGMVRAGGEIKRGGRDGAWGREAGGAGRERAIT